MITPYITFSGECSKALTFYQEVFETNLLMSQTYDDYVPAGVTTPPKDLGKWILHAEMEICGTIFWFADEIAEPVSQGNMVKLTATVSTSQEAQRIFDHLHHNSHITLPPTRTFYSSFHAGLVDKYGISWNIVAEEPPQ